MKPLALTLGDPAGIGPEIVLKALAVPVWRERCLVFGNKEVLQETYQQLKNRAVLADPDTLTIIDLPTPAFIPAQNQASSGAASFNYLSTAITATRQGETRAIVTGPISKTAWHQAGHIYPGQTEVLAQGYPDYGMFFVARSPHTGWCWRVLLATTHLPLAQVPLVLNAGLVRQKLDLLTRTLTKIFKLVEPRISVPGLNPHSGEGGQLGREEQDWLIPLLQDYPLVEGPVPPDTLWVKAGRAWFESVPAPDGYLALYHDQGLIPLKLLAFDQAVNMTVGLPFLRTSPDHGTAFDIVGQGVARADSLLEALFWADQWS
ncbi:4-hydroxythreonine-4-phosphate dehydrogenase PdxA [Candidatus Cyanaurora vandensis]|uniref:4-hydroxythreonine-4-phosphate dehydrogenase PdxA n=1 Tax=Candidatus Cyanaurora vandensis TaxID=2714958 RepID=UPI00257BF60F|nr:4-hydroxythreonine-4-phosphate dehydrogenase PdxA [Candidatus Cyanaurora vandensis]